MGRRSQDNALGGPPHDPDLAPDAILDLARKTLNRIAAGVGDAPVSEAFIESFCELLRSGDKVGAERMMKAATQRRAGYSQVADGLLSAAARRLGEMWERDEASFMEVSIGVSMIFRLNHEHAQHHVPVARDLDLRQAVFATLPGQAHNLGLVLAAEGFRQADWQVALLLDSSMGLILDRVRRLRPAVVGLSVSNLDRKHQLEHLIGGLQTLPFRFQILLGGTAADDVHGALSQPQTVTVVQDIKTALDAVAP